VCGGAGVCSVGGNRGIFLGQVSPEKHVLCVHGLGAAATSDGWELLFACVTCFSSMRVCKP